VNFKDFKTVLAIPLCIETHTVVTFSHNMSRFRYIFLNVKALLQNNPSSSRQVALELRIDPPETSSNSTCSTTTTVFFQQMSKNYNLRNRTVMSSAHNLAASPTPKPDQRLYSDVAASRPPSPTGDRVSPSIAVVEDIDPHFICYHISLLFFCDLPDLSELHNHLVIRPISLFTCLNLLLKLRREYMIFYLYSLY